MDFHALAFVRSPGKGGEVLMKIEAGGRFFSSPDGPAYKSRYVQLLLY